MKKSNFILLCAVVMVGNTAIAQRFKGGSSSRPARVKATVTEKPVEEKNRVRSGIGTVSSEVRTVPSLGSTGTSQLAASIKRDISAKPAVRPTKSPVPRLIGKGNLTAENSGQLNLHKFGKPESYDPANLRPDNYSLYLPNQRGYKPNWKQNSGSLRSAMRLNKPITDTYRDPQGNLIVTKGFLGAERAALSAAGWKYEPRVGSWIPPQKKVSK